jgi:parvulin-like peptidyl-prolyl isomerase
VRGESITLSRFRLEVAARKHFAEVQKIAYTQDEIDAFVSDQLVTRTLFSQVLTENKLVISKDELDTRINSIISEAGSSEKLSQFLREQYGEAVTIDVYRMWMHDAAVQSAIQQKLLTHAEIKHILVAVPTGSTAEVVEKARLKAAGIRSSITDVSLFEETAKARSEDASSRDKGGYFGTTNRGDTSPVLSEAFETAAFTLPVGQISDPILTPSGWHIITVVSREGTIDLSKKALLEKERKRGSIHTFMTK